MRDDDPWDEIEDIEENLASSAAKIAALAQLAGNSVPGSARWAELLNCEAEHHLLLGHADRAIELLESVLAAEAVTDPSATALLISANLTAGNSDRAAELEVTHRARSREFDLSVDYTLIGEAYEQVGELKTALRWYTLANRDVDPDDLDELDALALYGRQRVRRSLGIAADAYDLSAELIREETRNRLDSEGRR